MQALDHNAYLALRDGAQVLEADDLAALMAP